MVVACDQVWWSNPIPARLDRTMWAFVTTVSERQTRRRADPVTACTAALAVLLSLALTGCSTSISDFETSSDAPERSRDVSSYPAVHDLPAPRDQAAMDPAEQARVEKELIDARDRQAHATQNPESR